MMRIIAGRHRSRPLQPPATPDIRPTADRVREALFSILTYRLGTLEETVVCDAFCGSGALGLEALSRGAAHAYQLDISPEALALAKRNAATLGETARCTFLLSDLTRPPKAPRPCDLLLLDPPYTSGLAEEALLALTSAGWAGPAALAALEVARRAPFTSPPGWDLLQERTHGAARLLVLERTPSVKDLQGEEKPT